MFSRSNQNQTTRRHARLLLLAAAFIAITCPRTWAQDQEPDPSERARFRLGPLRFTPSISLSNLGVDDNVFNEVVDPKQDRTAAIGPAVDLWMHAGSSLFTGNVAAQYLYYDQYANQRAWNNGERLKWGMPVGRFVPFIDFSHADSKTRPGFEIDSRVRQKARAVGVGTDVRLGRTTLSLSGTQSRLVYDDKTIYLGTDLAQALNQKTDATQIGVRYKLTSLTTFVVTAEALQDRFTGGDTLRNSDSVRVLSGFEMKPSALVSGKVMVGLRDFKPLDATVPPFRGPVAAVDATWIVRATRLQVRVARDLSFSFQPIEPYYALTDVGLTLTERIRDSWDLQVTGGRQTLGFRRLLSTTPGELPQHDEISEWGGGIGYRFGRILRLSFDGTYIRRQSTDPAVPPFTGMRAGASVTYGIVQ